MAYVFPSAWAARTLAISSYSLTLLVSFSYSHSFHSSRPTYYAMCVCLYDALDEIDEGEKTSTAHLLYSKRNEQHIFFSLPLLLFLVFLSFAITKQSMAHIIIYTYIYKRVYIHDMQSLYTFISMYIKYCIVLLCIYQHTKHYYIRRQRRQNLLLLPLGELCSYMYLARVALVIYIYIYGPLRWWQ